MSHNVGYCCINTALRKQKITTNRGMIKRTFLKEGLPRCSELALQNARDLIKIIQWNHKNDITLFRIGSGIFPWGTEYDLEDLPDFGQITDILGHAGELSAQYNQRISAHPDHFVKLGSVKEHVVDNSIKDLELQSRVFDMMFPVASFENPINIHVGMNFSQEVVDRWITAYRRLSPNLRARLVVENDDKASGFSVKQLHHYLHKVIDIPITFDYFHHQFHPDELSTRTAAYLAAITWPYDVTPLFHYSESKNLNENTSGNPRAHSDYVFNEINDFGLDLDIDLEAKAKEQALFKYKISWMN